MGQASLDLSENPMFNTIYMIVFYETYKAKTPPSTVTYPLSIVNVLEHVEAVLDDGLQYLLVFVSTLANAGQIGHNVWQQFLVVLWKASKLTFSTLYLLLNMDPAEKDLG